MTWLRAYSHFQKVFMLTTALQHFFQLHVWKRERICIGLCSPLHLVVCTDHLFEFLLLWKANIRYILIAPVQLLFVIELTASPSMNSKRSFIRMCLSVPILVKVSLAFSATSFILETGRRMGLRKRIVFEFSYFICVPWYWKRYHPIF